MCIKYKLYDWIWEIQNIDKDELTQLATKNVYHNASLRNVFFFNT